MSNFIEADFLDFLRGPSWRKVLTALNAAYWKLYEDLLSVLTTSIGRIC
jgi:hypothetical protein